jgi:hypothetical protein
MRISYDRKAYINPDFELLAKDERFNFEVWGTTSPIVRAVAFGGKGQKPIWNYRFKTIESLNNQISESLGSYMRREEVKQEYKAKRSAPHDVQLGDVFRCSWGYDQTNIDYYEVTKVLGAFVEITPIRCMSEETMSMQGESVPCVGSYFGEPMRKKVSMITSEPSIRMNSYSTAFRMKPLASIGNAKVYQSSHWTAYA